MVMRSVRRLFQTRRLVLESPVWSWVMVVGCLSRASSYWIRPPEPTPATVRIEQTLSYPMWTAALLIYAAMIAVGTYRCRNSLAWTGHLLGLGASTTLALSVLTAAAFDGASWAGFWPLIVVSLVHWGRLNALGPRVAEKVKQVRRA